MTNIYTLLLMSVSGTLMYLLSRLFAKRTRYCVWQYAMLITSVIMLLVPIQKILEIPRVFSVTVPKTLNMSLGGAITLSGAAETIASRITAAHIIIAVWFAVLLSLLARIAVKYIKTAKTLRQLTKKCYSAETLEIYFSVCKRLGIRKNIELLESKYLKSPLLFGIFRPVIIIPDKSFSKKELEMILAHELTHCKHCDLWISLGASIAQCVHWFNPAVYFMGKSITETCELFCDETVIKHLNAEDKKSYGSLILSVIETELNSRLAYTTSMASAKDGIQTRLRKIVEFKIPTKASKIAGIMIVFACSVSALTAFGFKTAAEVMPEEVKQIIPIAMPAEVPLEEVAPTTLVEPDVSPAIDTPADSAQTEDYSENITEEGDNIQPEINDTLAENPDLPEEIPYEQSDAEKPRDVFETQTEPRTSYIFNTDFENGESASGSFAVKSGDKLSVNKISGSDDVPVSVHNALTGEIIYDEREDKTRGSFQMTVPEDGEYYITAYSESGSNTGIYIYGE